MHEQDVRLIVVPAYVRQSLQWCSREMSIVSMANGVAFPGASPELLRTTTGEGGGRYGLRRIL